MLQTDTNTVSSAFTVARFLNSESISGNPLGLRIAAGNAPNLVDPTSGTWGKVVLDPINITQNTTFAKLNTLGSLIATYITTADDGWRERFLKAATPPGGATPKSTLEAMTDIARTSWAHPKDLYALFDEAYPQPPDGSRRKAPFWMPGSQSGVLTNIGGGTVNFSPNGMALSAPVTASRAWVSAALAGATAYRRTKSGSPASTERLA